MAIACKDYQPPDDGELYVATGQELLLLQSEAGLIAAAAAVMQHGITDQAVSDEIGAKIQALIAEAKKTL